MKKISSKYFDFIALTVTLGTPLLNYKKHHPLIVSGEVILLFLGLTYYIFRLIKEKTTLGNIDNEREIPFLKNGKYRILSMMVLFILFSLTSFFVYNVNSSTLSVAEVPELNPARTSFGLIETYNTIWVGGGSFAIYDKNEGKPFANTFQFDENNLHKITNMFGTSCALKFSISPKANIPYVNLDSIKVFVTDYQKPKDYEIVRTASASKYNFFYVEIDNPKKYKGNFFYAQKYIVDDSLVTNSHLIIEQDTEEVVVVRINALVPGIYKIRCEVIVSHKNQKETVVLNEETTWVFQ